mmetsp:Transcript_8102/g.10553  ORF Transcript_8102/g.10553 Transcript_8102/m.10553 type:complete len:301 (+) Transcript_8102:41-943(+)
MSEFGDLNFCVEKEVEKVRSAIEPEDSSLKISEDQVLGLLCTARHKALKKALASSRESGYSFHAVNLFVNADNAVQQPSKQGIEAQLPAQLPFALPSPQVTKSECEENQIYSRITLTVSSIKGLHLLSSDILTMFNLVALQPTNQQVFQAILNKLTSEEKRFDIIQLDCESNIKVTSHDMVALRRASVFVEICYGDLFDKMANSSDTENSLSEFSAFVTETLRHVSQGHLKSEGQFHNILFSSGKCLSKSRRTPAEVKELSIKLGLNVKASNSCVSSACLAVLSMANKRRTKSGVFTRID